MYRNYNQTENWQLVKYITPERAGALEYDANVDIAMTQDVGWLGNTRLNNQFNQFKMQTMVLWRKLRLKVLQYFQDEYETGKRENELPPLFSTYVDTINGLLDNVEIRVDEETFTVYYTFDPSADGPLAVSGISSGESELIALTIEALVFSLDLGPATRGLLLIDEPDVHLHPDLQARWMVFLVDLVDKHDFDVLVATHSTPILGQLSQYPNASVCFMRAGYKSLTFSPIDSIYKELLPVFGAHPLTQVFNETRTLLVEGDDDVRIWQQAVKSSNGALKVTPVGCNGKDNMKTYERRMGEIVASVYDNGTAYSLQDRDDKSESIEDLPPVVRMRLSCRSAENLLLSDEVLSSVAVEWSEVQQRIGEWCVTDSNKTHEKYHAMTNFIDEGFQRKDADLKEIRMLLVGQILESEKPWEVLVGQAIAKLTQNSSSGPNSLLAYLGEKVVRTLKIGQ
jgi:hypothetical protein